MLSPVLEEIAKENKNFKVTKLDVDGQKKFARKFKVMSIPTLIVFENGVETNRIVGGVSKEDILDIMK